MYCSVPALHEAFALPFENGPGVQIDTLIEQPLVRAGSPVPTGSDVCEPSTAPVGAARARGLELRSLQTCVHMELGIAGGWALVSRKPGPQGWSQVLSAKGQGLEKAAGGPSPSSSFTK